MTPLPQNKRDVVIWNGVITMISGIIRAASLGARLKSKRNPFRVSEICSLLDSLAELIEGYRLRGDGLFETEGEK